ncbi:MAG TPA: class I SAM-dependent methyltransferase [Candidatus Limnocylindrales bacterium]|jgi:hypothetical protein|nr:class I SAM-dependent methyltransferase [Candidatus Limnocylindrales bacterium]HZM11588.1 class I SAM-dependent methyltransferase [Candidatus Limnocylindrales bacterium]
MGVVLPSSEYDDELLKIHLQQASEALPGPDYYTVLRWIHEILRPANYVEIGVRQGGSLRAALPDTTCIAIDPLPALAGPLPPRTHVLPITSDAFFESYNPCDLLGTPHFSLAFIDGLHLFEQVLWDFIHLERLAGSSSIIILHDCLPLDRITSERVRTTHFYSGDVWKLPMCLKVHRPDLRMVTIRTPPTGLCLVSRLDPGSDLLVRNYAEYVAEYTPLDFDYYKDHPEQMPENIPNTFAAVSGWIDSLIRERDPAVDRSHK